MATKGRLAEEGVKKTAEMFEALDDQTERMTPWERDEFYPSVSSRFYDKGLPLSPLQYETLERMYRRLC